MYSTSLLLRRSSLPRTALAKNTNTVRQPPADKTRSARADSKRQTLALVLMSRGFAALDAQNEIWLNRRPILTKRNINTLALLSTKNVCNLRVSGRAIIDENVVLCRGKT